MAELWIKWTSGLASKREVVAMAEILSISRREVAATCMEFWEWADTNTCDGKISGVPTTFVDELVRTKGFAKAMEKVGWMRPETDGFRIPHFDRHNGNSAKKRALAQRRMSKMRYANVTPRASPDEMRGEEMRKDAGVPAHRAPAPIKKNSRLWVEGFIAGVIGNFDLPDNIAEAQRRAFARVGWDLSKRADRETLAIEFWKLASELRGTSGSPISKWQGTVNEILGRNGSK